MSSWRTIEATRHQVAIAGRITDSRTSQAIGRARVQIMAGPAAFTQRLALLAQQHGARWAALTERLDRTTSRADGHYHFLDLPDGAYDLLVSPPEAGSRYASQSISVAVARNPAGDVTMAAADAQLTPTSIQGQISAAASGDPIALAQLRLAGSGETTFSDSGGRYALLAVEAGNRRVIAQAQGYSTQTQSISLAAPGQIRTLNFALS